jgi:transposase
VIRDLPSKKGVAMTVRITRLDHTAQELRALAARETDAKLARRLLAVALVLEGRARAEAAQTCGMDRQTLRDWVIRYNEHGVSGLADRPHGGGPSAKLTEAEKEVLAQWVREGPDPAEDGIVRWRLRDLKQRLLARFFVLLDERSISRILKTLDFSHISVRPRHPQADAEAQEAHKKTLRIWSPPRSRRPRAGNPSSCGGRMKHGSVSRAA